MKCFLFCLHEDYNVELKTLVTEPKSSANLKMNSFPEIKKSLIRCLKISGLGAELPERMCEELD